MTNLLSKYHRLALEENSRLAGESFRIKNIAFTTSSMFQPAFEVPVWKPPCLEASTTNVYSPFMSICNKHIIKLV